MRAVAQAARSGVRCARVSALAPLAPRASSSASGSGGLGVVGAAGIVGACWGAASQGSSVGCFFFGSGESASDSPGAAPAGKEKRTADDAGPSTDSDPGSGGESSQPGQSPGDGEDILQPMDDLDAVETDRDADPLDDVDAADAETARPSRPASTEQEEGDGGEEDEPDRFDAVELQDACAQALNRELTTFSKGSEASQAALALEADLAAWVSETAAGTSRSLEENAARMQDIANEAVSVGISDGAAMETAATAARQRALDVQRADGEMLLQNDIACAAEELRAEHAGWWPIIALRCFNSGIRAPTLNASVVWIGM